MYICGEGNSNPLQCSCLGSPVDRGAWWAAVYGVTQSWTRLKRLGSSSSSTATVLMNPNTLIYLFKTLFFKSMICTILCDRSLDAHLSSSSGCCLQSTVFKRVCVEVLTTRVLHDVVTWKETSHWALKTPLSGYSPAQRSCGFSILCRSHFLTQHQPSMKKPNSSHLYLYITKLTSLIILFFL